MQQNACLRRYIVIRAKEVNQMIRKSVFGILCLCCVLLCATASAKMVYVDGKTASRVHLRSAASQQSESLGLFYTGTEAELTGGAAFEAEWERVKIGAMTGYIMCDYLTEERPQQAVMPAGRVKGGSLNLRAQPSRESSVLQVLKEHEKLVIMGQTANGWYYVLTPDNTIGYVMPEYVALTGESVSSNNTQNRRVGQTYNGDFIYSWPAPNGQTLYFAALEDPAIKFEDVNFDGHDDVIVYIIRGASNFFTEFFVWDDGHYVYAPHPGLDYGICNYQLYPEYGIVHSGANNGYAGALHEDVLMRWEGNELRVIRRAVSEHETETADLPEQEGYVATTYLQRLRVRVWDYSIGVCEGEKVYETVISLDELNDDEGYRRLFAGEQEALWKDIK